MDTVFCFTLRNSLTILKKLELNITTFFIFYILFCKKEMNLFRANIILFNNILVIKWSESTEDKFLEENHFFEI